MQVTKDIVHKAVVASNNRSIKVRTGKGIFKDQIYRGVLKSDLEAMLGRKNVRKAVRKGFLLEHHVFIENSNRKVYLWPYQEMSPFSWFKRLIFKITSYFKRGE